MAEFERDWRVFDRDSTNTCQIANPTAGVETATKTAQSTYWSCCHTIRTQILNCSKKCRLSGSRFCVETSCNGLVPGWNQTRNRPRIRDPLLTLLPICQNGFNGYTLAWGLQCNGWRCENLSSRFFYLRAKCNSLFTKYTQHCKSPDQCAYWQSVACSFHLLSYYY